MVAPTFRSRLSQLKSDLPQALLLAGEYGIGLGSLAREIAGNNLEQVIEPQNTKGDVDFSSGSINVERVRALYENTKGKSKLSRVVIIDGSEKMTQQAQNAFLKLLEEPPAAMKFILTTRKLNSLLPTVRSRLETHQVPRISLAQSQKILDQYPSLQSKDRAQLLFVADGRPALLHRLAANPKTRSELVEVMQLARQFITSTNKYDKLKLVSPLMASRQSALDFIDSCLNILWSQVDKQRSEDHLDLIKQLLHAHDKIAHNASPRLQMARIVLK